MEPGLRGPDRHFTRSAAQLLRGSDYQVLAGVHADGDTRGFFDGYIDRGAIFWPAPVCLLKAGPSASGRMGWSSSRSRCRTNDALLLRGGAPGTPWDRRRRALSCAAMPPAVPIVVFNLVPVVGVLFLGWDLGLILILYWIENGLVGLSNLPKILAARGSVLEDVLSRANSRLGGSGPDLLGIEPAAGPAAPEPIVILGRIGAALFFSFHYGLFWAVHGIFVLLIAAGGFPGSATDPGDALAHAQRQPSFWIAVGGLVVLRAFDLVQWFRDRDYRHVSALGQMGEPYRRVFVLHLTVLFGGVLVLALGQPLVLLLVLVMLKIGIDLGLEARQSARRAGRRAISAPTDEFSPSVPS